MPGVFTEAPVARATAAVVQDLQALQALRLLLRKSQDGTELGKVLSSAVT